MVAGGSVELVVLTVEAVELVVDSVLAVLDVEEVVDIVEVLLVEEFETALRYFHQDFVFGSVKIVFVDYVVQSIYQ